MNVMTDSEVREFETKNAWATGICIDGDGDLYYNTPEANCITLPYPETPLRATYFAYLASMLGTFGDEANFYGALLWLRYWQAGSTQLVKSGWRLVERMRMGFGELRPLCVANGHWFRADELADLAAFIVPCFVYGWDAYIVPSNADCFAFISHDGFWCVATRKPEMHARLLHDFEELEPRVDSVKGRFCRFENSGAKT
jgi:hypothetical protein